MFQQLYSYDGSGNEGSMTGTGNPLKDVFSGGTGFYN
jgi:hypothetical protein